MAIFVNLRSADAVTPDRTFRKHVVTIDEEGRTISVRNGSAEVAHLSDVELRTRSFGDRWIARGTTTDGTTEVWAVKKTCACSAPNITTTRPTDIPEWPEENART